MALLYLLILSMAALTLLLSPVAVRYAKDGGRLLSFHFVFFSFSLIWPQREEQKKKEKGRGGTGGNALKRALRYAMPRTGIFIRALPIESALSPDRAAILSGLYSALAALISVPFAGLCSDPLPTVRDGDRATLDIRFKIRSYALLYTFLVFLAQYRKERSKRNGRNEDE